MNHASAEAIAQAIQHCPEHRAEVLSIRHEVLWPDGSSVGLHPIRQDGATAQLLRAVRVGDHWHLIDLKAIIPRDEHDVRIAPSRDQVGLVMYALRHRFHNAPAFLARVGQQHLAKWPGEGRPATKRPKATKPARA